ALPVTHRHNRVVLFDDGRTFFHAMHAALHSAERFILVEYYMIRNDATGEAFAAELAGAAMRGVRVFLIYDYIGSIETPLSFFKIMVRQGIELIPFNVPSLSRGLRWFDRRDHRKLTVIDGSLAFLGGINIGDEYAGAAESTHRFHDIGFSISGSSVHELVSIFSETWLMERGELPRIPPAVSNESLPPREQGTGTVEIISSTPHHRRSYIRNAFVVNIATAAKEILIATPYFIPGPRIIRSLLRTARRGVNIRLLLPARSDMPLVRLLGRSYYGALLRKGIDIFEMTHEILHAKVMLIDGKRAIIGSANFDQRSFHRNFEINLVIDHEAFGRQLQMILLQDFKNSRRISLADHEQRGVMSRLLEKLIDLFGWFL
ncbi:MAG: phospholipase D-like domain-containing protein, partial [Syntrophales bacterium]|nr:phospholipase D-like domain-containing protein [Syntrophales bacterium]